MAGSNEINLNECKSRGSTRDGTGVHDSIVNQLLTNIDGVESLNNVLLSGMTNRNDLLDEALLRPGRLEVQVEISLPDENGRLQILQIHTNKMKENSFLARDVNLQELGIGVVGDDRKLELTLSGVSKLEQVFEGDEGNVSKDEEKVIHLPQLGFLELDGIPNPVSFSPVGYHFIFQSLCSLEVTYCPNITTRFSVDSEKSVHARTQASQSVDEVNGETTFPIGRDIDWYKNFN
ncbi:hypothetical protein ES288_A04G048600v1 [Gossypium darwinii]|uniref:Vesicle-fusing ATPase n=1 Tax=Gossypium darwinii TaxID=34276 RepID=A0A5D2GU93_GOSDA|nr:hypothetical protein ES288_A04G048600v1 [Gossypium darwinii]